MIFGFPTDSGVICDGILSESIRGSTRDHSYAYLLLVAFKAVRNESYRQSLIK